MQKRVNFLAEQPFLRGMPKEHLELLAKESMPAQFKPGELILEEGAPANRFYIILEGKVDVEAHEAEDGPVHIQTIGPGEVLGWSWLFPPYHWHFDARAITPVRAMFFYGVRLREVCDENPSLGYVFMRRLTEVVIHRLQSARADLVAQHHRAAHSD